MILKDADHGTWAFCEANPNPKGIYPRNLAQNAVSAITIANQSSWKESFGELVQLASQLCLMPEDDRCAKELLRSNAFYQQRSVKERITIEDFCRAMNAKCQDGQVAIIQTHRYGSRKLYAVLPEQYTKFVLRRNRFTRYQCIGPRYPRDELVSEVWIRWADRLDHSPFTRRNGRKSSTPKYVPPEDHEFFHYHQANPRENCIGDCTVRALASVLDVSWNEAMDKLAESTAAGSTAINSTDTIDAALKKEGFVCHEALRKNGKLLTGTEFCTEAARLYPNGKKIFALVGSTHVAAVLPFREDGKLRYKLVDSWDSSRKRIDSYYIPSDAPAATPSPLLQCDQVILHPLFGRGVIQNIPDFRWAQVRFPDKGTMPLEIKWILKNCTVNQAE